MNADAVIVTHTHPDHWDDTAKRQLPNSMPIFERPEHASVYIAGDTTWHPQVAAAIRKYRPEVIVLNTGYASITGFEGSIIMGKEDLARARKLAPDAVVIGVHMEAVNHASQSRAELIRYIAEQDLDAARTRIPADGESYRF